MASSEAAENMPNVARSTENIPDLARLAAAAIAGDQSQLQQLDGLPADLAKAVWKEVKAAVKRQERPVACRDMFPFVRACWRVESVDLCDAGRWVTDDSLAALACVP